MVLDQHKGALAVPISAVDQGETGAASGGAEKTRTGRVLVVTPQNRIELRQVALGIETANKVEVISGLKEGDLVVVGGRSTLQAGQSVQPKMAAVGEAPSKEAK